MDPFCPHSGPIVIEGVPFGAAEVIAALGPMVTSKRRSRIETALAHRTYTVTPVIEGLYDRGNVSAVVRSAEALGYQSVHIVDSSEAFKHANRVTQGAEKWLDINVWSATEACLARLKKMGYRIVATHFEDARPIGELRFDQPAAIVFGNERDGVSEAVLDVADVRAVIPMAGFTKSFNISVAAALCLYHVQQDRIRRLGRHGDLDEETMRVLRALYYIRTVPNADRVLLDQRKRAGSP